MLSAISEIKEPFLKADVGKSMSTKEDSEWETGIHRIFFQFRVGRVSSIAQRV